MLNYRFLNRDAFVFTLEMLFAIMLAVSFLAIATVQLTKEESQYTGIELKKTANSVLSALDENGFFLTILDDNSVSSGGKATLIHSKIVGLLGENVNVRTKIRQYDLRATKCQQERNFEECFEETVSFTEKGSVVPEDKQVVNEKIFLVKRQPPAQCEISEEKISLKDKEKKEYGGIGIIEKEKPVTILFQEKEPFKFLFKEEKPFKLLFQGSEDVNIYFGVSTTPSDELECDEEIRVDLNVQAGEEGERVPADIMLVMDVSGSMNSFTVPYRVLGSGSFNDGIYICNYWWYGWCIYEEFENWQTLTTFEWDEDRDFAVRMYYSGYNGEANPRLRLITPTGSYYPSEDGYGGGVSPITIEVEEPAEGTWTVQGWSDDLIEYDLNLYLRKIDVAKDAAKNFIDLAEWTTQDYTGLVSFATDAKTEQPLTSNRTAVKNKIDTLRAGGLTATGDGIYEATDELQEPPTGHGREEAKPFQVLMSNGQHNYGSNPITAAEDAADKGIIIYTIGFGEGADEQQLTEIAEITGGKYAYAGDANALQEVYEWIAQQIGASLIEGELQVFDSNLLIPVPDGMEITDTGGGSLIRPEDENFLYYDIGDLSIGGTWQDFFNAKIPCDVSYACEESSKTFPMEGSVFNYSDGEGEIQEPVDWNGFVTVNFKYRDLTVNVLNAEILGENELFLDVKAENVGWLDSDITLLDFYLEDPETGQFLKQESVTALCGELTGCGNWFEVFYNVELNEAGYIYVIINRDKGIRECLNNNIVQLYCTLAPRTQYYSINVWAWIE